ncbi:MAG: hypothetical protein Q9214_004799, partial [Letrouitia sp. 1 TL-2023]
MPVPLRLGDLITLTQLAWRIVQNARRACGEHDELTRDLKAQHTVLLRLEKEVSKVENPINRQDKRYREELEVLLKGSKRALNALDQLLQSYSGLSQKQRGTRKFWLKVRFGNGEIVGLQEIRARLTYYTSAMSLFLNMLSLGSIGRVEKEMTSANEDLKKIRFAVNRIGAHLLSGHSEGSVLTTYSDDDKAIWKRLRKELIAEGCSSSVIEKNMDTIKAYVRELCERGLLDEVDAGPNNGKKSRSKDFAEEYNPYRKYREEDFLIRQALDRSPIRWKYRNDEKNMLRRAHTSPNFEDIKKSFLKN